MFRSSVIVIAEIIMFFHSQAFLLPSPYPQTPLSCFSSCLHILISPHTTQDSTQTVVVVVSCFTCLRSLCPTLSQVLPQKQSLQRPVQVSFCNCVRCCCALFLRPTSTMFKISLQYKVKTQPCSY